MIEEILDKSRKAIEGKLGLTVVYDRCRSKKPNLM